MDFASHADDQHILQIALELIEQFNIRDFKPSSLLWAEFFFQGGRRTVYIPVGWCVFTWEGQLILPIDLKGKLEPDEWRPLLASSLIYASKLARKRGIGVAARAGPLVFLEGLGFATLLLTWPSALTGPLFVADVGGLVPVLVLGILLVNPFLKRLRLEADKLAADHLGKSGLLEALEKINGLGLKDSGAGGRGVRPTLAERIQHLQQTQ